MSRDWQEAQVRWSEYESRRNEVHAAFDACTRSIWPIRISVALCVVAEYLLTALGLRVGFEDAGRIAVIVAFGSVATLIGVMLIIKHSKLYARSLDLRESIVYLQATYWLLAQAMTEGNQTLLSEATAALSHKDSTAQRRLVTKYRLTNRS